MLGDDIEAVAMSGEPDFDFAGLAGVAAARGEVKVGFGIGSHRSSDCAEKLL